MFRNNLSFAFRILLRYKMFSAINIAGLTISLTAFILIALYVESQVSFDNFHLKGERIYRVVDDKKTPDLHLHTAKTAAPVAVALSQEYPQVEAAVRLIKSEALVKYQLRTAEEKGIYFADPSFFNLFNFVLLEGNGSTALKDPNSIVLTKAMAAKYFGREEPMGKTLELDETPYKVTGLLEDVPSNSHLQFDFLLSMSTAMTKESGYSWMFDNWYSNNFFTYLLLRENADVAVLSKQLLDFDRRHDESGDNTTHEYALESLSSVYMRSDRVDQADKTGNLSNIYILSVTALLILLLACVNFINLSTARAAERFKEIALKKIVGASKQSVIWQFITESFIMVLLSLILATFFAYQLIPFFNQFSQQHLSTFLFSSIHVVAGLLLLLLISFAAGFYPAVFLSDFKPAAGIKGNFAVGAGSKQVRKGLVVFQFTISVVMIICSVVVYKQLQFMNQFNLGFQKDQTLVINFHGDASAQQKYNEITAELERLPGVASITASSNVPGDRNASSWSMDFIKLTGDTIHTQFPVYLTDYTFNQQYRIPVIAGRNFSNNFSTDSTTSMLINETAMHTLGFASPEAVLGMKVGMYPSDAKVVGVIKDFHFESLQHKIRPLAIRILPDNFRFFSVRLESGRVAGTVAAIESKWKQLMPQRPFESYFLDESFNRQYESERKFAQVFSLCTFLGIFIACLGLFGLALLSIQQRMKEVGVRKVLGASVHSIVYLVTKDFIKLVIVALVIASPISWYITRRWLDNFAYQVSIGSSVFIAAGALAIIVALLTVSVHALKLALSNPVRSLRSV